MYEDSEIDQSELKEKTDIPIESDFYEMLKVKPKPKTTTNYKIKPSTTSKFSVNVKVIDKTSEELVDPISFLSKINIGIVNKGDKKIEKPKPDFDEIFEDKTKTVKTEKPDTINEYIRNISKTETLIKIKQINAPKSEKTTRLTKAPEFKTKKQTFADLGDIDENMDFGDTKLNERLPESKPNILIKADSYYLNNREIFIDFINKLFLPYENEIMQQEKDIQSGKITISCDNYSNKDFSLLIHQKIVRDYINIYTPYRGLLLFHGLGSGKTCSSIAISEGLKNNKQVIVMTPASLRDNYIQELKKCGDYMYKRNQYWEFISLKTNPEYLKHMSAILHLPEEYITKKGGAWFINNSKESNYESEISINEESKKSLDEQIDKMISYKYKFISYNGLRNNSSEWLQLTQNNTINPFNDKVIIIDEAHNLISRIVNKLRINSSTSLSLKMYKFLMSAENCKIILLSGTPIINYPNEISILFNILRGYIKSYNFKITTTKSMNLSTFEKILKDNDIYKHIDYINYNSKTKELEIYKNPFGFIHNSDDLTKEVKYSEQSLYSSEFLEKIKSLLESKNIKFVKTDDHIKNYKALPDLFEEFKTMFLNDDGEFKNKETFIRRIIGLTSYFRSAQEDLMPKYNQKEDFEIIEIPMSASQYLVYSQARADERKMESNNKKKNIVAGKDKIFDDNVSTYRIFSRAFCNFIFPKDIERPLPKNGKEIENILDDINKSEIIDESILESTTKEDLSKKINELDGNYEQEDIENMQKAEKEIKDSSYQDRINEALNKLEKESNKYLNKSSLQELSPKFLNILENIQDESTFPGIHLLYSQFKTLEGIGIFKLVLKENIIKETNTIYIDLKLEKTKGSYELYIDPLTISKIEKEELNVKFFASYTGSESSDEREIILNILNSNWNVVPQNIITSIKKYIPNVENNNNGEVIKLLMISSSGAEGISLKNVRYVHIMEPYWHPVRKNQVIGRARRICSHSNLPKDLQYVKVMLYLMKFSDEQMSSDDDKALEIKKHDKSKFEKDPLTGQFIPHTTDQFLNELSTKKETITNKIFDIVKSSAIDCVIHSSSNSKENIKCFSIENKETKMNDRLMYVSNYTKQENEESIKINQKEISSKIVSVIFKLKRYLLYKNLILSKSKEEQYFYDYDKFNKTKIKLKVGNFNLVHDNIYDFKLYPTFTNKEEVTGKIKIEIIDNKINIVEI